MSIKEYVSKKVLEARVKEQNLIIDQLQVQLRQAQQEFSHISCKSASALKQSSLDESVARIEKARLEAEQQKTISDFSEIMKERHISVPLQQETEYSLNKKFKEMIQSTIKIIP